MYCRRLHETQLRAEKWKEDGNARDEANLNSSHFQELEKGDVYERLRHEMVNLSLEILFEAYYRSKQKNT